MATPKTRTSLTDSHRQLSRKRPTARTQLHTDSRYEMRKRMPGGGMWHRTARFLPGTYNDERRAARNKVSLPENSPCHLSSLSRTDERVQPDYRATEGTTDDTCHKKRYKEHRQILMPVIPGKARHKNSFHRQKPQLLPMKKHFVT